MILSFILVAFNTFYAHASMHKYGHSTYDIGFENSQFNGQIFYQTQNGSQNIMLFNTNSQDVNSHFNENTTPKYSCTPPNMTIYVFNQTNFPEFIINNNNTVPLLLNFQLKSLIDESQLNTYISNQNMLPNVKTVNITIPKLSNYSIVMVPDCQTPYNSQNYFDMLQFSFNFSTSGWVENLVVIGQFYVLCDMEWRPTRFDPSLFLLLAAAVISLIFMSRFREIVSFQTDFTGFKVTWLYAIFYILFFTTIILIAYFIPDYLGMTSDIIISIVSLGCDWFFVCELLSLLPQKYKMDVSCFKAQKYQVIRLQDIISAVFSILLVAFWWIFGKPWYLNDIMALGIIGTCIKIFIIKSMKNSFYFMLIVLIFDSIGAAVAHQQNEQTSYDTQFLFILNDPLELQVPMFFDRFEKFCAWIPITSIVFPGFFIAYTQRIDSNYKSQIYSVLSISGFSLGCTFYLLSTIFHHHAWPMSIFCFPVMFLLVLIFAYRGNKLHEIWNGYFFDTEHEKKKLIEKYQEKYEQEGDVQKDSSFIETLGGVTDLLLKRETKQTRDTRDYRNSEKTDNRKSEDKFLKEENSQWSP